MQENHEEPIKRPEPDFEVKMDENNQIVSNDSDQKKGINKLRAKRTKKKLTKKKLTKKKLIVIASVLLAIIVVGLFLYFHYHHKKTDFVSTVVKTTGQPIVSRLTGLPVTAAEEALPVTGVMIENSLDARPQSGLSDAGVVFEALAEGGITRFLALYETDTSTSIGPVRSARPYFIDWLLPFDAGYAHVGGSPQALAEIQSDNVRDLNQFYNGSYYTRVDTKEAPHNVYTSTSELVALEETKGYTTSSFTGFARKAASTSAKPTATNINMNISGPDYLVNYKYDQQNNSYLRSEGGSPHIDANTNQQIDPKVVIAMIVPESNGPADGIGAYYSDYQDIGSGQVYVFQDGTVTTGTWEKASATSQLKFLTTGGQTLKLNAGQTWITALSTSSQLSYSS